MQKTARDVVAVLQSYEIEVERAFAREIRGFKGWKLVGAGGEESFGQVKVSLDFWSRLLASSYREKPENMGI